MTNNARVLSHLGMARRAGKLVAGDESVMASIRSGEAKLVIVAADAADNARKKYRDKCDYYKVDVYEQFTRAELGASIGQAGRVVLSVTDAGFARMIREAICKPTEVE